MKEKKENDTYKDIVFLHQLFLKVNKALIEEVGLNNSVVLTAIEEQQRRFNKKKIWINEEEIRKKTSLSIPTIRKCIKELEQNNYLVVDRKQQFNHNYYMVNEEEISKEKEFLMIDKDLIQKLKLTKATILSVICEKQRLEGNELVNISIGKIKERTNLSEQTITNNLKKLEESHLITIQKGLEKNSPLSYEVLSKKVNKLFNEPVREKELDKKRIAIKNYPRANLYISKLRVSREQKEELEKYASAIKFIDYFIFIYQSVFHKEYPKEYSYNKLLEIMKSSSNIMQYLEDEWVEPVAYQKFIRWFFRQENVEGYYLKTICEGTLDETSWLNIFNYRAMTEEM